MIKDKVFTFKCDCGEATHNTKVWVDKENDEVLIYASLNHYLPWYKRLPVAFKYLLGIDNTFVQYEETFMSVDKYTKVLNEIKNFLEEK